MKKELIIILTLFGALFSGCTKDTPDDVKPSEELSVFVDILKVTKATYNKPAFVDGDTVSMWVTTDRGAVVNKLLKSGNYADNNPMIYNITSGKLEAPSAKITFPTPNSRLGVYCVYPYKNDYSLIDDENKTMLKHQVATDQTESSNYKSSDLMTGSRGYTGYNVADMANPGSILMYHRMARLDITVIVPKIYGNASFVGDSFVKLHGQNVSSLVQMSVSAEDAQANPNTTMPAVASGNATTSIQMHKYDENTTTIEPRELKFEAVIVPQTIASGVVMVEFCGKFRDITDELKYFYSISGTDITFEGGKSYSLKLSISNMKPITFGDVTVTEWGATSSDGSMEE